MGGFVIIYVCIDPLSLSKLTQLVYEHTIHQTDDQNFEVYKSTLVFAFHAALCFHNCRSTPNARDLCFANSFSSCSVLCLCCGCKELEL